MVLWVSATGIRSGEFTISFSLELQLCFDSLSCAWHRYGVRSELQLICNPLIKHNTHPIAISISVILFLSLQQMDTSHMGTTHFRCVWYSFEVQNIAREITHMLLITLVIYRTYTDIQPQC
jgi:hypothetical protein